MTNTLVSESERDSNQESSVDHALIIAQVIGILNCIWLVTSVLTNIFVRFKLFQNSITILHLEPLINYLDKSFLGSVLFLPTVIMLFRTGGKNNPIINGYNMTTGSYAICVFGLFNIIRIPLILFNKYLLKSTNFFMYQIQIVISVNMIINLFVLVSGINDVPLKKSVTNVSSWFFYWLTNSLPIYLLFVVERILRYGTKNEDYTKYITKYIT